MNRRHFWLIPEFVKFRMTFENRETVVGVNDEHEHRLFRKDAGKICFDEREALQKCIASLIENETEGFIGSRAGAVYV